MRATTYTSLKWGFANRVVL